MRVLIVTGDRHATARTEDRQRWEDVVRAALAVFKERGKSHEPHLLIHGACGLDEGDPASGPMRGIDAIADRVGRELGFLVVPIPANWTRDGNPGGPIRNKVMVDHGRRLRADGAHVETAAFHDRFRFSRGTKHAAETSAKAGIPTMRFRSDGAWAEVMP